MPRGLGAKGGIYVTALDVNFLFLRGVGPVAFGAGGGWTFALALLSLPFICNSAVIRKGNIVYHTVWGKLNPVGKGVLDLWRSASSSHEFLGISPRYLRRPRCRSDN